MNIVNNELFAMKIYHKGEKIDKLAITRIYNVLALKCTNNFHNYLFAIGRKQQFYCNRFTSSKFIISCSIIILWCNLIY